jgi:hypothetical protein
LVISPLIVSFYILLMHQLNIQQTNKQQFGAVFTPSHIVNKMLDLLPSSIFESPNLKWLDPGCGHGVFASAILDRQPHTNPELLTLIEINPQYFSLLEKKFREKAQLIKCNYLDWSPPSKYDIIIGNPPYNCNGSIKVPTNKSRSKKQDGKSVWQAFIIKSLECLAIGGYLCFIVPSLWLKPDKAGIYEILTQYKIHNLFCMNASETNRTFGGQAQTPTTIFLLQKIPATDNIINIWEKTYDSYIPFKLTINRPIPMYGINIFNKLMPYVEKYGCITAYKTNDPSIKAHINDVETLVFCYKNVKTCILQKQNDSANDTTIQKHNGKIPHMVYNYSDRPLAYSSIPKLILAHKMYGFPYYDITGDLGISARDNYIILAPDKDLLRLQTFLSTKFIKDLFGATSYRMRYLERYIFELLPNICVIPEFPEVITDETIMEFFCI